MTFMLVPVLAPNIGQLILFALASDLLVLAGYALAMLAWSWSRLPKRCTRNIGGRSTREMRRAMMATVREPQSRGYTLATTISFRH